MRRIICALAVIGGLALVPAGANAAVKYVPGPAHTSAAVFADPFRQMVVTPPRRVKVKAHAAGGLGWLCTLGGGIMGGGFWLTLSAVGLEGGPFLAIFAGAGFAAGCEMGTNYHHPEVISGLPRTNQCWKARKHRFYGPLYTECFL